MGQAQQLALLVLGLLAGGAHATNQRGAASKKLHDDDREDVLPLEQFGRDFKANITEPSFKFYIYKFDNKTEDKEIWNDIEKFKDIRDTFYGLDQLFPDLLHDSPYVTDDPAKADYFYVDKWMYWPWGNPDKVVAELRRRGPWWDRKKGADHVWSISNDNGRCNFGHDFLRPSIFLHHFGRLLWIETERCDLFKMWGAECDWEMEAGLSALNGRIKKPPGCHLPHHDIIVPPTPYEWHDVPTAWKFKSPYTHKSLQNINRTDVLFYSGKIDLHEGEPNAKLEPWSDASYSFGSRQLVYRMHHHRPNYKLHSTHTHGTYWHDLSSSVFCLAAAGWAWGGRMKVAASRGCIPVIVQDGMKVEWEENVPMKDYAIRVPNWMVHKLHDILDAFVKTGRAEKMQKVLQCSWRLHLWRRPFGRAFELTMCELKRRKLGAPQIHVNWDDCTLECGDGKLVYLKEGWNNLA